MEAELVWVYIFLFSKGSSGERDKDSLSGCRHKKAYIIDL